MATAYYTPGVYIEEIDKGAKPIQGVSTSVTAFVGITAKAEKIDENGVTTKSILGAPTLVTNWGQYERMFGSYHKDAYLPYAVRGFFDNGGSRCYVISIQAMDAHRAQAIVYGRDERTERNLPVLLVRAVKPGKDGDALSVTIETVQPENGSSSSGKEKNQQKRLRLTVQRAATPSQAAPQVVDEKKLAELRQQVGDLKVQVDQTSREVNRLQRELNKEHTAEEQEKLRKELDEANKRHASLKEKLDAAQKELGALEGAAGQMTSSEAQGSFEFTLDNLPFWGDERAERGKWDVYRRQGTGNSSAGNGGKPAPAAGSFVDQRSLGSEVEVWKLNKQGWEAAVLPALDTVHLNGGSWQFDLDLLNSSRSPDALASVTQETDQSTLVIDHSALLYRGGEQQRKGIDGLFAFDDVNLICAPDLMKAYEVLGPDRREEADRLVQGVQESILNFCARAHYPFAILDAPPDRDVQAISEWRMTLPGGDTPHGAIYYPWIKIVDPMDAKRQISIPPSGHLAGLFARSDSQRGVHKAPANEIVAGAVSLQLNVTKNEQELLNPMGVNCIRAFPGRGIRVWGARTLAMTDPAWRYINVRRLFSYVEASIERSTQWVVFEPNDHVLWGKVRRDVSAFLRTVWLSGALFGLTPEEAFYVKCDEETNLPVLRDLGQMVCEIGMSPVKPAEFVIFRFSQWTSDVDTAE